MFDFLPVISKFDFFRRVIMASSVLEYLPMFWQVALDLSDGTISRAEAAKLALELESHLDEHAIEIPRRERALIVGLRAALVSWSK